jgi:hypothetical protein
MERKELLWRQYELHVDLYKHYLKLCIEINALYYAITGAIVSYFFAHAGEANMRLALVLPLCLTMLLGAFFVYGAHLMRITRAEIYSIRDSLDLESAPDTTVLIAALFGSATMMGIIAVGLTCLLLR